MTNKETYYKALMGNNGQINEIDLGEIIGLKEEETREIIAQLLSEYKIEYVENRICNYSIMAKLKRKNNCR